MIHNVDFSIRASDPPGHRSSASHFIGLGAFNLNLQFKFQNEIEMKQNRLTTI